MVTDMVSYTREGTIMPTELNAKLRTTFKLSAQEASLMVLLMSMDVVPSTLISNRLDVRTEVRVAMHRLRKTLSAFQIEIESKRHLGYWLTPETKDKIRRRLQ